MRPILFSGLKQGNNIGLKYQAFPDPMLGTEHNPREEPMFPAALTRVISPSEYSSIKGTLR